MADSRPRIFKYDNVKLLAIVLVVIGSFSDPFTAHSDMFRSWYVFSYSFTAPLFIFLSGLFQKQFSKENKPDIHKISFYLLLGLTLKLMIFGVQLLCGEEAQLNLLGGSGMEWFLFVISAYMVTMYLLRSVQRYVMFAAAILIGIVAGYLPLGEFLTLMRFLVFLPFYVAGYYLSPVKVRRFTHRLNVKLAAIAFIFTFFVLCFRERETIYLLRSVFTGESPYSASPLEGCSFYHRMLCYGISAVLIISVMACVPNRKFPLITKMGRNTLGVYFWHYPLVLLFLSLATDTLMGVGDPMWKYLILMIAVVLALVLSLSAFSFPLKKLRELIERIPTKICLSVICVMIAAAAILQFTVLN